MGPRKEHKVAQEANRSIADDAANKAKQAVKVAKDTAKAAQAVGKAASKAASGGTWEWKRTQLTP